MTPPTTSPDDNRRRYAEAAAGLLDDLGAAGFPVDAVAELRRRGTGNRRAVPVLARWLPRISYAPLKRDVIAALGSTWARPDAARPLIEEFRRADPDDVDALGVRWAIGSALESVADGSVYEDLAELARERRYGRAREMVVLALGRTRDPRAVAVLTGLLGDPDVAGHAVMALGRLGAPESRTAIEPFLHHPQAWIRKEAEKALARLAP